ncbi:unnamed protein product [Hymenolepis diminuta]|uniref:Uncharacterized protein n=1 Tax=Hymenolepis diminuta TaxID=6216 RepID=A0A564YXI1_HYMDI|nr:unnamed protein product [Hymenolepis diminuta]
MATWNGLHRYLSQMEESLLELTQSLSVLLSNELDLEEAYANDKRRLLEETHGLNLDTQKCLKRLSVRFTRSLVTNSPSSLCLPPLLLTRRNMPSLHHGVGINKLKSTSSFVSSVGQSRQEQPPPRVRREHTQLGEERRV